MLISKPKVFKTWKTTPCICMEARYTLWKKNWSVLQFTGMILHFCQVSADNGGWGEKSDLICLLNLFKYEVLVGIRINLILHKFEKECIIPK